MKQTALIYYPGHLGAIGPEGPLTDLRTAGRGIRWDREVKPVPEPDASDLVNTGGFYRCLWIEEVMDRYGLERSAVTDLVTAGRLATAEYRPAEGSAPEAESVAGQKGDPITVVVLDRPTRVALRKASKAAASDAEKAKKTKAKKITTPPATTATPDTPAAGEES